MESFSFWDRWRSHGIERRRTKTPFEWGAASKGECTRHDSLNVNSKTPGLVHFRPLLRLLSRGKQIPMTHDTTGTRLEGSVPPPPYTRESITVTYNWWLTGVDRRDKDERRETYNDRNKDEKTYGPDEGTSCVETKEGPWVNLNSEWSLGVAITSDLCPEIQNGSLVDKKQWGGPVSDAPESSVGKSQQKWTRPIGSRPFDGHPRSDRTGPEQTGTVNHNPHRVSKGVPCRTWTQPGSAFPPEEKEKT